MTERLLQFIWQFQYFNKNELCTDQGETLSIIYQGQHNVNQGPDFLNAKIVISDTTLIGNIELHVKSSDWMRHSHASDSNYSNIILHVVWEHNAEVDCNGVVLSSLSLQSLIPKVLLQRYQNLMASKHFVPCEAYLPVLNEISWLAWKERLAVERLQRKSVMITTELLAVNGHWEEAFWRMLARNFGIKVNAEIFEAIAKTISVNILAKHKNQIHQLEGLMLGQAGLLDETFNEEYPKLLQREYRFLQKKYQLKPVSVRPFFLRMRPANFPTIRLSQLAMLIHTSSHLFSKVRETNDLNEVMQMLNVAANDYWHYHYRLDEPGDYRRKQLGKQMVENIVINTIIPVLFSYGLYNKEESIKDKSVQWLSGLSAEKNIITNKWTSYHVSNKNALESQALIELKKIYCEQKFCLDCSVGTALLRDKSRSLKIRS
jgi:hypothetical protein